MSPPMKPIRILVALSVALGLASCGGSDDAADAGPVSPDAYVRSVCVAMVRWTANIGAAFEETEARPATDVAAILRTDMLDLFDGVQDATDTMRAEVTAAGNADVPEGVVAARDLQAVVDRASAALKANRADFADIAVTDVQPAASIEGALTVLADQFKAVQEAVGELDRRSPDLRRAREAEPACTEFETLDF